MLELSRPVTAEIDPRVEARLCPENDDLPSVEAKCYAAVHKAVLERDGYRCQYPGCSVRHGLHVHHIELRSHFGRKSWAQMNEASNLIVLCYFHHRMLHAGIIGLKGRAPGDLDWRRPKLLESARLSYEELGELAAPMDEELGLDDLPPGLRPAETVAETMAEIAASVSARLSEFLAASCRRFGATCAQSRVFLAFVRAHDAFKARGSAW